MDSYQIDSGDIPKPFRGEFLRDKYVDRGLFDLNLLFPFIDQRRA